MNVPVEILEKLKCSNCEELLSCGPVVLKQDGSNICGRCSSVEEAAVPNLPYNSLASLCTFPCKYSAEGCHEKLPFSSVQPHEADCAFRTYICPVAPSGSCEWIGCKNKILEHTRDMHPDQVLQHPCEMTHDVRTASSNTFLTAVFDVLFLVHVKVCLVTHTIYHSVRKIGEIHETLTYKFQLNIETKKGNIIRKEMVAPQGCLALQEDTSLGISINAMMEVLNGFDDATFNITIEEYMDCYMCQKFKSLNHIDVCDKFNNLFCCKSCSSSLKSCKNAAVGCQWKGETSRHENYLCTYIRWCDACNKDIREVNFLDHMRQKRHNSFQINHLFGKYWRIHKGTEQHLTISFQNITYYFIYIKQHSNEFFLQSVENDTKIKCILNLRNPKTKFTSQYIMNKGYTSYCGQFYNNIYFTDDKLQPFISDDKFEFCVDIYC